MIGRTLLAHYRRHPLQAVFLLVGIITANALLVGTQLLNAQARASYAAGERLLGLAPIGELRAAGPLDEELYFRLRRQGFDMLVPELQRSVRTAAGESLQLQGIDVLAIPRPRADPDRTGSGAGFSAAGRGLAFPPYRMLAAPARMAQLGWPEGHRPRLADGVLLPPVAAAPEAQLGHRLLLDIGLLQALTGSAGELSAIQVFPTSAGQLEALRAALPAGVEWVPGAAAPDPGELTHSLHLNLAAMGWLSFVVGLFLVYNALAFSYTDRAELLRRLRLVGVARGRLARALALELAAFTALGGLLGAWLGGLLAAWLLPGLGQTLAQLYAVHIAYPDRLLGGGALWAALPMTAAAAGLCALLPLRRALAQPLVGRQAAAWSQARTRRRDLRLLLPGAALLILAAALGTAAQRLPAALAGMAALLLGAALCLPAALRALLRLLARLAPPGRPLLGWLLADSRWLLGPASVALMALALALVANSGLNTMVSSFRQATDEWLQQRLTAPLYLRGSHSVAAIEDWLEVSAPGVGVEARHRTRIDRPVPAGGTARVEIVTASPAVMNELSLVGPRTRASADGRGLFVSERAWRLDGWVPGAALRLCPDGRPLSVLGVYRDYGNPLSQWLVEPEAFRECWPGLAPVSLALRGPPGTDWPAVSAGLAGRLGIAPGDIVEGETLRRAGMEAFDRTFAVTRALNLLTLLVAGIGVFCAVSAIHHHRIGQQALLAALGVGRGERAGLLLGQWGLFGVLTLLLAFPLSVALAAWLAGVVTPVAFGWSFPLRLDPAAYAILGGLASASLVLAVALPSLRLLRTPPGRLLREGGV